MFDTVSPQSDVFSSACLETKKLIYETIILPVVLYGCETLSVTLREEHRLRVFENRVPKRIFGTKREEVTGDWRKLVMRSFITCALCQVKLE
jgi:hypothetical protein